jgi:hypothetical protein
MALGKGIQMILAKSFMVVSFTKKEVDQSSTVHALSPDFMQWGENRWLISLGAVESYWCGTSNGDLPQKLRELLDKRFHASSVTLIGQMVSYRAAFARNPWRALLLHSLMEDRKINGLVQEFSQAGEGLFQHLRWDHLWRIGYEVYHHLRSKGKGEKESRKLKTTLLLMEKAFSGIGIHHPENISRIPSEQIERRFSDWGLRIWEWTWWSPAEGIREIYFPWIPWLGERKYEVTHFFEHELRDWSAIENELRCDLVKLSKDMSEMLRIFGLRWTLYLEDESKFDIPVVFRYPMNLFSDLPNGKIILKHLYHSFWGTLEQVGRDDSNNLGIKAWSVEVTKHVYAKRETRSLFHSTSDFEDIKDLETRTSVQFFRFYLSQDPWPEYSYRQVDSEDNHFATFLPKDQNRPLFLWKSPIPSKSPSHKLFLERVSQRWWEKGNFGRRDYYKYRDEEGQSHWVFKDQEGIWYKHGIYA